jgi:hypothetical protein
MFKDPVALIDETITNLETLKDVFQDEFDSLTHSVDRVNVNGAICRHAHGKISALIPVLRAARQTQLMGGFGHHRAPCLHCD